MIQRVVVCLILGSLAVTGLFAPKGVQADAIMQKAGSDTLVPLYATFIRIDIYDQVAMTTVEHVFHNTLSADSMDVTYMFPLPEGASVTGFGVYVDDTTLVEYQLGAAATGGGHQQVPSHDPYLAQYLRPNPFVISLRIAHGFNRFQLRYIQLLPYWFGEIRYTYRLDSDRYTTGSLAAFQIEGTIRARREILKTATSPLQANITQIDPYQVSINLTKENWRPDVNFTLTYKLQQTEIGVFSYAYRDTLDPTEPDGYFVLILEPPVEVDTSQILPKTFTFIIDRSGSMSGVKIEQAKSAALYCLDRLLSHDYFNVIWFNHGSGAFSAEPVAVTPEALQQARDFIRSLTARGMTNLYSPLMHAVRQPPAPFSVSQIILLTDGYHNTGPVVDPSAVIDSVTVANRQQARIYVFGIGSGIKKGFLQELASRNHGIAVFVEVGAAIDSAVATLFEEVRFPLLTGLKLHVPADVYDVYPVELPDLHLGSQLIVSGRYRSPATVQVQLSARGTEGDSTLLQAEVTFPERDPDYPFVMKIWAKMKIEHLYQLYLIQGQPDSLKEQIIQLSLKYGILSPFTKFTEPGEPGTPPGTPVEEIEAPWLAVQAQWNLEAHGAVVRLEWVIPSGLGGPFLADIYRADTPEGPYSKLNDVPVKENFFLDRNVVADRVYYYRIVLQGPDGQRFASEVTVVLPPRTFILFPNYPNPFNSGTRLSFWLPRRMHISLAVYDALGRKVRQLVDGELESGFHRLVWEGQDDQGRVLASGLYLVVLRAGSEARTQKVIMLR